MVKLKIPFSLLSYNYTLDTKFLTPVELKNLLPHAWKTLILDKDVVLPPIVLKNLEHLTCSHMPNLSFLPKCQQLHTLDLKGTIFKNLSSIRPGNIQTLNLSLTRVVHLHAFRDWKQLKSLSLLGTNVYNIESLKYCVNLERLSLLGTRVEDISPLQYCTHLKTLNLLGTKVKNINILLHCQELQTVKLGNFHLSSEFLKDVHFIRS